MTYEEDIYERELFRMFEGQRLFFHVKKQDHQCGETLQFIPRGSDGSESTMYQPRYPRFRITYVETASRALHEGWVTLGLEYIQPEDSDKMWA